MAQVEQMVTKFNGVVMLGVLRRRCRSSIGGDTFRVFFLLRATRFYALWVNNQGEV